MKKQKITVMFPINSLEGGGAEQQLLELVRGIDKRRFKPIVVTLYAGYPLEKEVAQVSSTELISVNRKGKYDFRVIGRMLSLLRQKEVDVIQPFLTPATLFGLMPALINKTPVKIVTERSGAGLETGFGYKLYQKMEDYFTRYADWIVPNSEAGRSYLIGRGLNPARIKVISNGLNFERLTPDENTVSKIRKSMGLLPESKVVGMVANLTPAKDYATFLQAARIIHEAIPATRFAVLGDGSLRPDIENMTRDLGIEPFVTFFGHQTDIASYISCFDVSCLCSNYVEGCSNATLESMAMGKPVVVSDVGGNREVVDQGKTGLLVPVKDPEALADNVCTLLESPDLAFDIGRQARKSVLKRFSLERMVRDYEQLYEDAVQRKLAG